MRKVYYILISILLVSFLSSCSSVQDTGFLNVNMDNYSSNSNNEKTKTFKILSNIKGVSEDDLEFQYITNLIKRALTNQGYTENTHNPHEVIFVNYGTSTPYTSYYTTNTPHYGITGYSSQTYGTYTSTQPNYGVTGYTSNLNSYILYDKLLDIESYRKNKPLWNAKIKVTSQDSKLRNDITWAILAWSGHIGVDYHSDDKISFADPRLCTVLSLSNHYTNCTVTNGKGNIVKEQTHYKHKQALNMLFN